MAFNTTIQVRVDEKIKEESEALFKSLGFDTATAVRMFLTMAVNMKGMPFDVSKANFETQDASENK